VFISDDGEDLHDEGHSLEFTAGETRKSPFKVNDLNRKDIPSNVTEIFCYLRNYVMVLFYICRRQKATFVL